MWIILDPGGVQISAEPLAADDGLERLVTTRTTLEFRSYGRPAVCRQQVFDVPTMNASPCHLAFVHEVSTKASSQQVFVSSVVMPPPDRCPRYAMIATPLLRGGRWGLFPTIV
jgi:hypothetical protein